MITGSRTIISREAAMASRITPPATISSRSVIADATASPRGTASSPLMSAGGIGRCPFCVRRRVSMAIL